MQLQIIQFNVPLDVLKDLWSIIKGSWDNDFIDKSQKSFNVLHMHMVKIATTHDYAKMHGLQHGKYVANREEAVSLWNFLRWHLDEKVVTDAGKITQVSTMLSSLALALDGKAQKVGDRWDSTTHHAQQPNSPTTIGLAVGSKKTDQVSHPDSAENILEFPARRTPDDAPTAG